MTMEESDQNHVGAALRELCAVHRVKYGSDMFKGYWAALRDLSKSDFDSALADLQKHAMWMPKPAEFRAALRKGWL
jgi:hypothetical protein